MKRFASSLTRSALFRLLIVAACDMLVVAACDVHRGDDRSYQLRGQILGIDLANHTVTIRHDDIQGFMPAMTMPFKVKDPALLEGRTRGDLVVGRLVVTDTDAYLVSLDVVGHGDVSVAAGPSPVLNGPDLLRPGDAVPEITLKASDGTSFSFSSLRGSVVALTFIYTRCPLPQFCPLMDRQFRALAARLGPDPVLARSVRLLSISFDPEHDTPPVLAEHGRALGADGSTWRFVTADRPALDAWAPRFGLSLMRDDPNVITHNLRTAVVDRRGRLAKIYDGNDWTVDDLFSDIRRLLTGS